MAFLLDLAGASPGVSCAGEAGKGRAVALARATALGSIMADILLGSPLCFSAVGLVTGTCEAACSKQKRDYSAVLPEW